MKEDFLHYIWQYQLVTNKELTTNSGSQIFVLKSGNYNTDSGPDFFNALIRIEGQLWAGNVEIHVRSSDWYLHGHEKDMNYDNVILHVVWDHDVDVFGSNNKTIPTLELKSFVDKVALRNYKKLFSQEQKWINCERDIASVNDFTMSNWLEKLYIERLEQKTHIIEQLLIETRMDWEAVLFILIAKSFGLRINGEVFMTFASTLDFNIVRKLQYDQRGLEALFFGYGGFLNNANVEDPYYVDLQKEFKYLVSKFKIKKQKFSFQFFRLRPSNFPTIRLAQLGMLYHIHKNLFSKVIETNRIKGFYELFNTSVSEYWRTHYSFTSTSKESKKNLSKKFIDLLIINTIIPLKFVYFKKIGKLDIEELLISIRQIKPERNAIISTFDTFGIDAENAVETQALIQLKNEYCSKQKCLNCMIGRELLNRS